MEAHKVVLAAASPFFEKILQRNKHSHPLIYLRGFQSQDLMAILDFLYLGEANVYQENLGSFLASAEELKLKGLTGKTSCDEVGEEEKKKKNPTTICKSKEPLKISPTHDRVVQNIDDAEQASKVLVVSINQFSGDLEALDEKVKSMMD